MGTHDERDDISKIVSISSANFRSLNSNLHLVLFSGHDTFDYLPHTREIRPYSSCQWFKVSSDKYDTFLDYICNVYEMISSKADIELDTYELEVGFIMDSIIAIDLNKLMGFLIIARDELYRLTKTVPGGIDNLLCVEHNLVIEQCETFKQTITEMYAQSDLIRKAIELEYIRINYRF